MKKKNRCQSEDCENADAMSSSAVGGCNSVHTELMQTQQWLFMQMQTGLPSPAASRFVFIVDCQSVF